MGVLLLPAITPAATPSLSPRLWRDLPVASRAVPDNIGGRNFGNAGFFDVANLVTDDSDATFYSTGSSFGHIYADWHTSGSKAIKAVWVRFLPSQGTPAVPVLQYYTDSTAHISNGAPNGTSIPLHVPSVADLTAGRWHRFELGLADVTAIGWSWGSGPAGSTAPPIAEMRFELGPKDGFVDVVEFDGKFRDMLTGQEYVPALKPTPSPLDLRTLFKPSSEIERTYVTGTMPASGTLTVNISNAVLPGRTLAHYSLLVETTAGRIDPSFYQNSFTFTQFGCQAFVQSTGDVFNINSIGTDLLGRPFIITLWWR